MCHGAQATLETPYCDICAQPGQGSRCARCVVLPLAMDGIRAPYLMEGAIRDAVHALKYRNYRALAPELGRILAEYLESTSIPVTVLVPVPMHRRRIRQRGYNQALLLALEIGKLMGIEVADDMLIRRVDSPPQVLMKTQARRSQIADGSFLGVKEADGEAVLLIDDVVTTGSTMAACAKAVMERNAASVWGLALARES